MPPTGPERTRVGWLYTRCSTTRALPVQSGWRHTELVDRFDPKAVRSAYEATAEEYAASFGDNLEQVGVDRSVLETLASTRVVASAPVLDVGCGPAQVGSYLASRVFGPLGSTSPLECSQLRE